MTVIPSFECRTGCTDCCGPVPFTADEKREVEKRFPVHAWVQYDETHWIMKAALDTFTCPMAKNGKCAIYDIRPMICRLFGAVDHPRMKCPHGCGPSKLISEQESRRLLAGVKA